MSMVQMQAHQAYVQADGQLSLVNSLIRLPRNKKVTVLWEEDTTTETETTEQKNLTPQQQAVMKFMDATEKINSEGFDDETLKSFEKWDNGDFRLNLEGGLS